MRRDDPFTADATATHKTRLARIGMNAWSRLSNHRVEHDRLVPILASEQCRLHVDNDSTPNIPYLRHGRRWAFMRAQDLVEEGREFEQ